MIFISVDSSFFKNVRSASLSEDADLTFFKDKESTEMNIYTKIVSDF